MSALVKLPCDVEICLGLGFLSQIHITNLYNVLTQNPEEIFIRKQLVSFSKFCQAVDKLDHFLPQLVSSTLMVNITAV